MSWYSMSYHTQNIAIWVLILVLAVLVVAAVSRKTPGDANGKAGDSGEPPEQILKRRYAAGEIDRETYQRMLADLQRGQSTDREEVA